MVLNVTKVLNVTSFGPKCAKGPKCNSTWSLTVTKVLNVTTIGPKCNKGPNKSPFRKFIILYSFNFKYLLKIKNNTNRDANDSNPKSDTISFNLRERYGTKAGWSGYHVNMLPRNQISW